MTKVDRKIKLKDCLEFFEECIEDAEAYGAGQGVLLYANKVRDLTDEEYDKACDDWDERLKKRREV